MYDYMKALQKRFDRQVHELFFHQDKYQNGQHSCRN